MPMGSYAYEVFTYALATREIQNSPGVARSPRSDANLRGRGRRRKLLNMGANRRAKRQPIKAALSMPPNLLREFPSIRAFLPVTSLMTKGSSATSG